MTQPPPQGQMYLFDSVTPPLADGSYRMTTSTTVGYGTTNQVLSEQQFFDVVGPRFSVPQAMVAGMFPPNNGHGTFQDDLPHIVLGRRTLPWERALDPEQLIGSPAVDPNGPPSPAGVPVPVPWVALLVFEEGEYTLLRSTPLEQVVPADVFARLGSPAGIVCDAVEADRSLLFGLLPSVDELRLLAHVRWVNVDDRELNAAGGDGFYAVVVANRLPSPNAQCRAVLVSLEERSDLVRADPPPVFIPQPDQSTERVVGGGEPVGAPLSDDQLPNPIFTLSQPPVHTFGSGGAAQRGDPADSERLVALCSWQFTCEGPATFRQLMQNLNVAVFGSVAGATPALADTGHIPIALQDRSGATERVWYRGPLAPFGLTRDTLGPYHAADQARRVTPETGAEDVSYAAAFEVGRLLGAADTRFSQALMRWRRDAYRQSARADTLAASGWLAPSLPTALSERLHAPVAPIAAVAATGLVAGADPPIADAYGLAEIQGAPGLDPSRLFAAWELPSPAAASALLDASGTSLGAVVTPPNATLRADTSLSTVASDTASLGRLSSARASVVDNATTVVENG